MSYVDNTGAQLPATTILEANDEFPEGDRWEALAWTVPERDESRWDSSTASLVELIHEREFA